METILTIVGIILAIVNWILYHKIFEVTYFDLGHGLLKEILGCMAAAAIEMAIIGAILKFLGKTILVIFLIVLVLAIIVFLVYFFKKIFVDKVKIGELFKSKKKPREENSQDNMILDEDNTVLSEDNTINNEQTDKIEAEGNNNVEN